MFYYYFLSLLLLFAIAVVPADCQAGNGAMQSADTIQMLQSANALRLKYVGSSTLKGKSGQIALETLLLHGFRCGVEQTRSFVDGSYIDRLACNKPFYGERTDCEELVVGVTMDAPSRKETPGEVLDALPSRIVRSAGGAICPFPFQLSDEVKANRSQAERTLNEEVATMGLGGLNAKLAFNGLLSQGFQCGMVTMPDEDPSALKLKDLSCIRIPSQIKYCLREEIHLEVEWGSPLNLRGNLLDRMKSAKVGHVSSSCLVSYADTLST